MVLRRFRRAHRSACLFDYNCFYLKHRYRLYYIDLLSMYLRRANVYGYLSVVLFILLFFLSLLQGTISVQRVRSDRVHAGDETPKNRKPGQGRGAPDAPRGSSGLAGDQQHRQDGSGDRQAAVSGHEAVPEGAGRAGPPPGDAADDAGPEGGRHRREAGGPQEPAGQQFPGARGRHQRGGEREETGERAPPPGRRAGRVEAAQRAAGHHPGQHGQHRPEAAVPHQHGVRRAGQDHGHGDGRARGHRGAGQRPRPAGRQQDDHDDAGAGAEQQDRPAGQADAPDTERQREDGRGVERGGGHEELGGRPGAQVGRAAHADAAPGAGHQRHTRRSAHEHQQDHRQPGRGGAQAQEAGGRRGDVGPAAGARGDAAPGPDHRRVRQVRRAAARVHATGRVRVVHHAADQRRRRFFRSHFRCAAVAGPAVAVPDVPERAAEEQGRGVPERQEQAAAGQHQFPDRSVQPRSQSKSAFTPVPPHCRRRRENVAPFPRAHRSFFAHGLT